MKRSQTEKNRMKRNRKELISFRTKAKGSFSKGLSGDSAGPKVVTNQVWSIEVKLDNPIRTGTTLYTRHFERIYYGVDPLTALSDDVARIVDLIEGNKMISETEVNFKITESKVIRLY